MLKYGPFLHYLCSFEQTYWLFLIFIAPVRLTLIIKNIKIISVYRTIDPVGINIFIWISK